MTFRAPAPLMLTVSTPAIAVESQSDMLTEAEEYENPLIETISVATPTVDGKTEMPAPVMTGTDRFKNALFGASASEANDTLAGKLDKVTWAVLFDAPSETDSEYELTVPE